MQYKRPQLIKQLGNKPPITANFAPPPASPEITLTDKRQTLESSAKEVRFNGSPRNNA